MSGVPIESLAGALAGAGLLVERQRTLPPHVLGLTDDSRAVTRGSLFVAVRGSQRDGHDFLAAAADRGAVGAVVEDGTRTSLPSLVVRPGESRRAAAIVAAAYYGAPATELRLLAVTGTNGKSTTVGMLRHLLDEAGGARSASIGTIGVLLGSDGVELPGGSGLTTPGPIELQRLLRALRDSEVRTVAMEVSSHSLDQRRVDGVLFEAAVFTNFTRDHLDYHGTTEAYLAAKARLSEHIAPGGVMVVNADDPAWSTLGGSARRVTFGIEADADVRARDIRFDPRGSRWTLDAGSARHDVRLSLLGDFNVANALAAAATAWALGMGADLIAERLSSLPQVPGRLERLHERPAVLRDYAHTPDALARALAALRPYTRGRLIVVFGCGGERDRGKRPEMGAVAEREADVVVVTSDNPRSEDPERILDDIEAGMTRGRHERVEDRREAIARALAIAADDDVILLAGKGHETYQIRGDVKLPFDERAIVRELVGAGA